MLICFTARLVCGINKISFGSFSLSWKIPDDIPRSHLAHCLARTFGVPVCRTWITGKDPFRPSPTPKFVGFGKIQACGSLLGILWLLPAPGTGWCLLLLLLWHLLGWVGRESLAGLLQQICPTDNSLPLQLLSSQNIQVFLKILQLPWVRL